MDRKSGGRSGTGREGESSNGRSPRQLTNVRRGETERLFRLEKPRNSPVKKGDQRVGDSQMQHSVGGHGTKRAAS